MALKYKKAIFGIVAGGLMKEQFRSNVRATRAESARHPHRLCRAHTMPDRAHSGRRIRRSMF